MSKKDDISNQAKRLFAEKGYEGTAMDELASLANVNKASIYYYFKDKKNLYDTVFQESIERVYAYIKDKLKDTKTPQKALRVYIDAFWNYTKNNEEFVKILMREVASGGGYFPQKAVSIFLDILSILDNILIEGYKIKAFKKYDTRVVHFIIIGTISFFLASRPIRTTMLDRFDNTSVLTNGNENVGDELYKIILKGLEMV